MKRTRFPRASSDGMTPSFRKCHVRLFAIAVACCLMAMMPARVAAQQADPLVQELLATASLDSLLHTVRELSGDLPATVDDSLHTITTRHVGTADHAVATKYLRQKFEQYGLSPIVQVVDSNVSNVLVVQPGTVYPGRTWIICGHYDDMPGGSVAPGADDNGTGAATVLEAARVLSRYRTKYTIVYALWDSEEINTVGSVSYATQAHARKDTIAGVINIDMIGYDSNSDGRMEIHARSQSRELADTLVSINAAYNLGLQPVVYNPGETNSDHGSFWEWNYNAVWLIESYISGDFNPGYHSVRDLVTSLNPNYFGSIASLAIATLATVAGATGLVAEARTESGLPAGYSLSQNYPNPFNPTTRIRYQVPVASEVMLVVYDILGRNVATLVNEKKAAGVYEARFDGGGLASGAYFCRMTAGGFVRTRRVMLVK